MSKPQLVLRYILFAVIATAANLGIQRLVLLVSNNVFSYSLALFSGTLIGLAIKYLLDKRYIFLDRSTGLGTHSRQFSLYTAMGIVTTCIFWGTETAFWFMYQSDTMREIGALLGLALGYFVKYRLDRKYVFAIPSNGVSGAT